MISPGEISILRALKKTAIVLLLIYRLDKPVGGNEIAGILDMQRETAATYLSSLAHYGLITRANYHNGYILTRKGSQFIRGETDLALEALSDVPAGDALSDLPQVEATLRTQDKETAPAYQNINRMSEKFRQSDEKINGMSENFRQCLKEEVKEEDIKLINTSSLTSANQMSEKFRQSMADLLAATPILFGEPGVVITGLPERPAEMVLGWLAHAYHQRRRLNNPAGLAYRELQRGKMPGEDYCKHPERYLPEDYLVKIGWLPILFQEPEPVQEPVEAEAPQDDPSLDILIDGRHTARQVWRYVLDQLACEVPKPNFDTWLARTRPLRWSDNCLVIGAQSAYACDWLEGRLTSKITRLLCGILNRTVAVRFEVGG